MAEQIINVTISEDSPATVSVVEEIVNVTISDTTVNATIIGDTIINVNSSETVINVTIDSEIVVTNHNSLNNIQGGQSGEYYHMTQNEAEKFREIVFDSAYKAFLINYT